ncbi:hypothetical protein ACH5RR_004923 [Cinchona calisaya]|uniref:F-box protein SKIP8 n=1 Tax=Cinchona calisaya TaxID=153742 RepID=A0ABD3AYX9_9GENT
MEVSKLSAVSFTPRINRPSFLVKESLFHLRKHSSIPCSCIHQLGILPHFASNLHKEWNIGLAGKFQIRAKMFADCLGLGLKKGMLVPGRHASRPYLLKSCQVKSEDSEGTLTGESIIVNEQTLERELQMAIEEENYARAAEIRDSLRSLQNDSKTSVLAANARFYNAFRNGNLASMQALWSKGDNVCVVHPGVSGISGYDLVMGSWEFVWADYEFPLEIEVKDVQVHIRGDSGYVTCIEMVKTKGSSWGKQFATNVFEKIDGQWHICIHHASYVDL